jgi:hypothetical protein
MTPLVPLSEVENEPSVLTRRRRSRTWLPFLGQEDRDKALDDLSQRAFPHLDFYLYIILAAAILGLAVLLQSRVLFVLAAAVAPTFGPLAGLALGIVTLSPRFAMRNLAALGIAAAWAFLSALLIIWLGLVLGVPAAPAPAMDSIGLFLAAPAAILLTILFIRSSPRLFLSNVVMAYLFLAPLGQAAWRFASGESGGIPADLLALMLILLLAVAASTTVFCALGFRPAEPGWRAYAGAAGSILVTLLVLGGWVALGGVGGGTLPSVNTPTMTPTATETVQPTKLSVATAAETPTREPSPTTTETPGPTGTPTFAPIPAVVHGTGTQGANLRDKPNGAIIASAMDGDMLSIIGEPVLVGVQSWIPVRNAQGVDAWMAIEYCATVTPAPTATPK